MRLTKCCRADYEYAWIEGVLIERCSWCKKKIRIAGVLILWEQ